jgi:hypothetical protein
LKQSTFPSLEKLADASLCTGVGNHIFAMKTRGGYRRKSTISGAKQKKTSAIVEIQQNKTKQKPKFADIVALG